MVNELVADLPALVFKSSLVLKSGSQARISSRDSQAEEVFVR